jgi:glycosyltransferase involved in cell wall biosynthesis
MNPKVSIQIPTYNQADVIYRTVQSCLSQTYENIEINIADDCSSDNTFEVIKPFLIDKRVHYYKNKTNLGRVENYRKALYEYATGEWAINLDGDDFFCNDNFIKHALNDIVNTEEDVLFFMAKQVNTLDELKPIANKKINIQKISAKKYFENFFQLQHFAHLPTIFTRKYINEVAFYSKNLISADIHSFLSLCLHASNSKVILSTEIAGVWVIHGNNTSGNLKFSLHTENAYLYVDLYKKYKLKFGASRQLAVWFIKAQLLYWRSYIYQKIRKSFF